MMQHIAASVVHLTMQNSFLLYGANGYTGELIARYASQYGLTPILAGRSATAIEPLANKLQLPYKIFDLNDTPSLIAALQSVKVVVHAAGPFQFTAKQMIEACLQTGTHYLDINGDISIFEMIKRYDEAAKKAGVMLLPGAGFDVVPTDCMALLLKKRLPNATHLQLAFATIGGQISHGTATTMATKLGEGGAARIDGKIVNTPIGKKGMWIDVGPKQLFVMSIPWGDISTAHFTTGIPNIETFTDITPKTFKLLKLQPLFNWLLRTNWMRKYIKQKINQRPAGPTDDQRAKAIGYVWGKATNAAGETAMARLTGPEGYTITFHATLLITQKVLQGDFKTGYQTPAAVYGEDLVIAIPGIHRDIIC